MQKRTIRNDSGIRVHGNAFVVKELPVLPMWRLKGPDASRRTSRSRSLTQSRIATCHCGDRHRRSADDGQRRARAKERQERTQEGRRMDIATSFDWKWDRLRNFFFSRPTRSQGITITTDLRVHLHVCMRVRVERGRSCVIARCVTFHRFAEI